MTSPFTTQMIAWAQAAQALQQIPACINMGISAVESGMPPGAHIPAGTHNWHGITDSHGAQAATHEDNTGVAVPTVRGFKVFASPADSFAECARIIGHASVYGDAVRAYLASPRAIPDVRKLVLGIAAHWATAEVQDPASPLYHSYSKAVLKVMDAYNLYQYDELSVPAPAPASPPPASAGSAPQGSPPMAPAASAQAPAPVTVPSTTSVAPAAKNQTSLNIGDALEVLVKAAVALLPGALQAGETVLPPPLAMLIKMFGPSVFQGYITSAATSLEAGVAGKAIAIPSTGNGVIDGLVSMVVSQLNANEGTWVSEFAGVESMVQAQVTSWLATPHAAAIAPTLTAAAAKS